jgi:hypothetical protein
VLPNLHLFMDSAGYLLSNEVISCYSFQSPTQLRPGNLCKGDSRLLISKHLSVIHNKKYLKPTEAPITASQFQLLFLLHKGRLRSLNYLSRCLMGRQCTLSRSSGLTPEHSNLLLCPHSANSPFLDSTGKILPGAQWHT